MSIRVQLISLSIVLALSIASFVVTRLDSPSLGLGIGIAPLICAGWVFFGHLLTIDDDAPGGFSNPDSSPQT